MATENGYVKTFRQIESWEWYTDPNTFRVFMHLLLNASYKESKYRGEIIPLGGFATTYQKISEKLLITWSQARTAIDHLKSTGEIAVTVAPKFIIVVVQNWAKYQGEDGGERTQERTTERTLVAPSSHPRRTQTAPITKQEGKALKESTVLKDLNLKESPLARGQESTFFESNEIAPKTKKPRTFTAPTLDEVKAYCLQRNNKVNPQQFFDYFTATEWVDSEGKPVKSWKGKIITWESSLQNNRVPANTKPDAKIDWLQGYMDNINGRSS